MEFVVEACTRRTYFRIFGLDANHTKVHLLNAIIYYGSPYCDIKALLTCNKCLPCRQCFTCSICPINDFDIMLETPDGTIIGKISEIMPLMNPLLIGQMSMAFAGDVYAGRNGPDKEKVLPCCTCISPAEYVVYNESDEKLYTTICRCNIMELLCGCCRSCLCDRLLLEMYRPADSSKAFSLTEKCNICTNFLAVFCIEHVIQYEIEKWGNDFPNGMLPIIHACMNAALNGHLIMRLRGNSHAPLRSVLGGRVSL